MTETQKLLADYAENGSEPAFRQLVERYLDLVYSTALRFVDGDAHLAQDVAQLVFIDLARLARTLPGDVMLGGWLHRHTCFVAQKVMRTERRRRARERQAVEMTRLHDKPEARAAELSPIIDEAINQLGADDRAAVLLRFFEQRDFRTIGLHLGASENTARMRVNRALEKLEHLLQRRGVAYSAAVLGTILSAQAVHAAPAGFAAVVSNGALAGAAAGTGTSLTLLKLMASTKLKLGVAALLVAGAAATIVVQYVSQSALRDQNAALRQQLAQLQSANETLAHEVNQARSIHTPKLPAPVVRASSDASSEDAPAHSLYDKYVKGTNLAKVPVEKLAAYLKENHRDASSLLAAYRISRDTSLLEEAMQKFPNDPEVAFEAAFKQGISPEDRRQWLDNFKKVAPDNALANYLSAYEYFKNGQSDQAVQEFTAASAKQGLDEFNSDRVENDQEAYLAAGYSIEEAKAAACSQLLLPQLAQIKQACLSMADLAKSYQQAGDSASAQSVLQMTIQMGQRYNNSDPGQPMISELVGIAVERIALSAMDPNAPYGDNGGTAQQYLDQLTQQRDALRQLGQQAEPLYSQLSDRDWMLYKDRWMTLGEENALHWVINRYGQK